MNLYFRLILMFLLSPFKSRVSVFDEIKTKHIVWPNDIDILMHMNNGRYFTINDYVRIELLKRAGMWKELRKRKIYPVLAGETVQFRKSLGLFQRYNIVTKLIGWDDKFFYVEHKFTSGHDLSALMIVKVRFLGRNSTGLQPKDILQLAVKENVKERNMNDVLEIWNKSSSQHWQENKL